MQTTPAIGARLGRLQFFTGKSRREWKRIANRRHRHRLDHKTKAIQANPERYDAEDFAVHGLTTWDID